MTGASSDGIIAADHVTIGSAFPRRSAEISTSQGRVAAQGTVADASSGGFTLITADGARIPVTTSSDTEVLVHSARLSQFQVGKHTEAAGRAVLDGRLAAFGIVQGGFIHTGSLSVRGCSPSAVDMALAEALVPAG